MDWDEFRNLDLAEIGNWPRPAKLFVWGLMLFVITYLSHQLLFQEQMKALNLAEREERTLKLKFENKYRVASRLASRQQKSIGSQAGNMTNNSVASLLEQISKAGANSGLEFLLFQPESELKTTHYTELPIRIRVAGNYHSFGRFVSELASLSQAFSMQELRISRSNNRGAGVSASGSVQKPLIMELVVKRYRLPVQDTKARQGR